MCVHIWWQSVFPFADVMHCFELRTASVDYYVGEDPLYGQKDATGVTLPPADSGVGAHLAKSWETSIRQALMPVTSHPSEYLRNVKLMVLMAVLFRSCLMCLLLLLLSCMAYLWSWGLSDVSVNFLWTLWLYHPHHTLYDHFEEKLFCCPHFHSFAQSSSLSCPSPYICTIFHVPYSQGCTTSIPYTVPHTAVGIL
jgi:hypothetical protein